MAVTIQSVISQSFLASFNFHELFSGHGRLDPARWFGLQAKVTPVWSKSADRSRLTKFLGINHSARAFPDQQSRLATSQLSNCAIQIWLLRT